MRYTHTSHPINAAADLHTAGSSHDCHKHKVARRARSRYLSLRWTERQCRGCDTWAEDGLAQEEQQDCTQAVDGGGSRVGGTRTTAESDSHSARLPAFAYPDLEQPTSPWSPYCKSRPHNTPGECCALPAAQLTSFNQHSPRLKSMREILVAGPPTSSY